MPQPSSQSNATTRARAATPHVKKISEAISRIFSKYHPRDAHMRTNKPQNQLANVKERLLSESFLGVMNKTAVKCTLVKQEH